VLYCFERAGGARLRCAALHGSTDDVLYCFERAGGARVRRAALHVITDDALYCFERAGGARVRRAALHVSTDDVLYCFEQAGGACDRRAALHVSTDDGLYCFERAGGARDPRAALHVITDDVLYCFGVNETVLEKVTATRSEGGSATSWVRAAALPLAARPRSSPRGWTAFASAQPGHAGSPHSIRASSIASVLAPPGASVSVQMIAMTSKSM